MWIELTNIIAGLVLAIAFIELIPALGPELAKLSRWLGMFQTIIGVIAIVLGLWVLIEGGNLLQSVVAIIAGLVLAMGILPNIPALGKQLEKLAKWLGGFQTIIGMIALLVGLLGLLRVI